MFYGHSWIGVSPDDFAQELDDSINWYNCKRINLSLGGLSPIEYRQRLGCAVWFVQLSVRTPDPSVYLYDKRILFLILPAHFRPLLPMNIPDRKGAPKPDTQFHTSPFISCRPMAAERGLVRWNPDLIRKRWISKKKTKSKPNKQKSLKIVIIRPIFGRSVI